MAKIKYTRVDLPINLPTGSPNDGDIYFVRQDRSLHIWDALNTVMVAVGGGGAVTSVSGRTGAVTLSESDIASLVSDLATINAAITAESVARASAVTAEASARTTADGTVLAMAEAYTDGETTRAEAAESTLTSAVAGKQASLGFTPENVANKDTDTTLSANSDTKYASQKAAKAYTDAEKTRAQAAEATLTSAVSTETTRATTAEGTLTTAVSTEASARATADALLVPKTTTVNGHALSGNVTVSASELTTGTLPHAQLPTIAEADVTNLTTDLAAKAPGARLISTTAPVTGGGDLTADRTIAVSDFTGDAGSGGTRGTVPAPAAGDAAAKKYLKAGGSWTQPQFSDLSDEVAATATVALSELDVITLKINAANKDIILSRSAAASLAVTGSPNFTGSIQTTALANVAACTVSTTGGGAGGQWFYTVVARDAVGGSTVAAAPTTTINNGPQTLDGSHFNTIAWGAVAGAVVYDVYRTKAGGTSPTTVGVIGTVAADAALTFNDTGQVGDGAQYPAQNTTGNNSEPGITNQVGLAYFWGGYGPVMPIVVGANAALGNANKVQLALFYLPFAMLLNKLTVFVNAVSASANQFADFGIADINSNLLAHGQVNVSTGNTTGAKQAAISGSVTLQPGFYWFVWTTNSTDATFAVTVAVANANTIMNKSNGPFPRNGTGATTASGALPTKASATGLGIGGGYPNRAITAASLTLPYCLFE